MEIALAISGGILVSLYAYEKYAIWKHGKFPCNLWDRGKCARCHLIFHLCKDEYVGTGDFKKNADGTFREVMRYRGCEICGTGDWEPEEPRTPPSPIPWND